jgi:hypothetical protein
MAGRAVINPGGGAVRVELRIGFAQEGAYIITLWDQNSPSQRFEGNFLDPEDDTYPLAGASNTHVGRLLQARVDLVLIPPIDRYSIILSVFQDGRICGSEAVTGTSPHRVVGENLFIRLVSA